MRGDHAPGEVIVKLKTTARPLHQGDSSAGRQSSAPAGTVSPPSLDALAARFGVIRSEPLFRIKQEIVKRGRVQRAIEKSTAVRAKDFDPSLYRRMTFPPDANLSEILDACKNDPNVEFAEPNYIRKPVGSLGQGVSLGQGKGAVVESIPSPTAGSMQAKLSGASVTAGSSIPGPASDPLYSQQWHLEAINAPLAWQYLAGKGLNPGGSPDVVVAVIDSGVDYAHPDLAGNMWINSGEVPGNGVDDDGNGYVDDVYGANVVGDDWSSSGDPKDDHGHGTHVAGIIAAQGNNAEGGVGVAYNVQIMAVKAAQYSGILTTSDIAEGILYAVDKGADVINMSFGGYSRSQIEEDALAVAFGQAVLVAAAGNDGVTNEKKCDLLRAKAMYPASYPWVLGVMAASRTHNAKGDYLTSFSNWDCTPRNSIEYELMAPGAEIMSTLPGEQYAAWSGTSMAAPAVSGIAALLRSYFSDKDTYSSRFIMGQIAPTGPTLQGKTPQEGPSIVYHMADAHAALSTTPEPKLTYLEHWLFDEKSIDPGNDDDGRVDAGETIDLAMVIRNHWGKADNVQVTLRAWNGVSAGDDPYVTIDIPTIDYGAVGSFNIDDNGLIYDDQKEIVGVRNPFSFTVSPDCPNDHVIPFRITMTCTNGFDPSAGTYTFESDFHVTVQKGVELPRFISEDMTLTKENLYIVSDATLIKSGSTVTIQPGTQVQFWSSNPEDPYATPPDPKILVQGKLLGRGTAEDPVVLFPSSLYPDRLVVIRADSTAGTAGIVDLRYTRVTNPDIKGATVIDHCHFDQDAERLQQWSNSNDCFYNCNGYDCPAIESSQINQTVFHKLSSYTAIDNPSIAGFKIPIQSSQSVKESLFDSCVFNIGSDDFSGNVLLKNVKRVQDQWANTWIYSWPPVVDTQVSMRSVFPRVFENRTYLLTANVPLWGCSDQAPCNQKYILMAESYAEKFGGHVASINSIEENNFLIDYFTNDVTESAFQQQYPDLDWWSYGVPRPALGLTDWEESGVFEWLSGEPLTYTNWEYQEPFSIGKNTAFTFFERSTGAWYYRADSWNHPPLLLKSPGAWTQAEIDERHEGYVLDSVKSFCRMKNNAILNCWQDPNPDHWLRVVTNQYNQVNSSLYAFIHGNYWSTQSKTLIDASIKDFYDDMYRAQVIYEPILTDPPEDAYPFVTDVVLSTQAQSDVTTLGAEPVTFTVKFNRDMNMSVQPEVSFGPDTPMTDYTVHPVDGGWTDARTWRGTFNITPVTGDGYQFIRVAGAQAADDPWLVTGDDSERFRFEIITSGTESMQLQAAGGEGRIDLSWFQDDFELLAGFHLYRSTSEDGADAYVRINPSIIANNQLSYVDTNVEPGQPYYYKFTVVRTDMSESDFSNVASAAPFDTIPPVIQHTPITSATPRLSLQVHADVTDNVAVTGVSLFYRKQGASGFTSLSMTKTTGNRYSATIPGIKVVAPGIEYYLSATDGVSIIYSGSSATPYQVSVDDRPNVTAVAPDHGPFGGGTLVTVSGTNFVDGCTVALGGVLATDVTFVSDKQITCKAPAHFPAQVDVAVTNPGGSVGTLYRGYTYESSGVTLELPAGSGATGSRIQVPIAIGSVAGLVAARFTVSFDGSVLSPEGASVTGFASNFSIEASTSTPGQMALAMSSGVPLSGSGQLAIMNFLVTGSPGATTTLQLQSASLNDGSIVPDIIDGSFHVNDAYRISGSCAYHGSGEPVEGVNLALSGVQNTSGSSDADGNYAFVNVPVGACTVTPAKSDGVGGAVSALDASVVLQAVVGLTSLNGHQTTAADVDRSGAVSPMDASYILQYVVGLVDLPFPGSDRVWAFDPAQRTYASLGSDQADQNFTAVLVGDVNGNWTPDSAALASAAPRAAATASMSRGTNREGNRTGLDGKIRVSLGKARRVSSDRFSVPLHVKPARGGIYSGMVVLKYPAKELKAISVTAGAMAKDSMLASNLDSRGEIRIALASPVAITEAGELLTVTFQSKRKGPGRPAVRLREVILNDHRAKVRIVE